MSKLFLLLAVVLTPVMGFSNLIVSTPDKVMVTEEGLYLKVDGECVLLESIEMANDGYIVAIPRPIAAICPICRSDKYVQGRICPCCGFPLGD